MRIMKHNLYCAFLIAFLCFMVIFMPLGTIYAESEVTNSISMGQGEIETIVDLYFQYRNSQFFNEGKQYDSFSLSEEVRQEAESRKLALQKMANRIGVVYSSVDTQYRIAKISVENVICVYCSEWNLISYVYPGQSNLVNEMGFGSDHVITMQKIGNGYEILTDSFDERTVSGACSQDFGTFTEFCEGNDSDSVVQNTQTVSYTVNSSYNGVTAALYAETWVNSHNLTFTDYDNDGNANTSDCANFVSQCTFAGGMPVDQWVSGGYTTKWYPDSAPWINVAWFNVYWQNKGYQCAQVSGSLVNMSYARVGNPIFWLNSSGGASGHLMICVGADSNGIPTIDAHSSAVSHVPITNYTNTLYTLFFTY